jgi:sphinganine C4-monooxygenase
MSNLSVSLDIPPLPTYSLTPRELIIPPIPDYISLLIFPFVAYWVASMAFHWIDINDYFPQYRLHTPVELLKRNHVSRWEVVRDVIVQQIIQTAVGIVIGYWEDVEHTGREDYDIAVWARRIRIVQMAIPRAISLVGLDAAGLAENLSAYPMLAGALGGGRYPSLTQSVIMETGAEVIAPAFAQWELAVAGIIYWYLVPTLQFLFAIVFVDTWQYFLHRAMHMNKWLYSKS